MDAKIRNCTECSQELVLGVNYTSARQAKRYSICKACLNARVKRYKNYTEGRKTSITRIHGRSSLERRLVKKYSDTLTGAAKRQIDFTLSRDLFISLAALPCHYCGQESTETLPNGLDRVDSALSYCIENVVPCCKVCNWAKNELSTQQYLDHCAKVYNRGVPCQAP